MGRRVVAAMVAAVVGIAAVGCAGGGDADASATADIKAAVDGANRTFADGDYERTCSYYTPAMRRQITTLAGARTCADAQRRTARTLRAVITPAQFDAITRYGISTVAVNGDAAMARYGPLPELLEDVPGLQGRLALRMARRDGAWLIASLPR